MVDSDLLLKIPLSVIIIAVIYFIIFWNFPERYLLRRVLTPLTKYIWWAGLNNTWSLFAPDPLSQNLMVGFELEYADGKVRPWRTREFEIQDLDQNIPGIRYVRAHRQLVSIFSKVFSKSICRYILRQLSKNDSSDELPVKIHINRYQEPESESAREIIPWVSVRVFTYLVDADMEQISEEK